MPTHSAPMIPRQTFFENAACLDPRLSPDGQWISYLSAVDGVMNVWLAPRRDVSEARPLTRQVERPVWDHWFARTNAHVLFRRDTNGDENFHVWCVGLAGGEPRDLTPYLETMAYIAGFHLEDPHLVAIAMNDRDARWHDLYVVDIRTGDRRILYTNTEEISRFVLDSHLGLRLAETTRSMGSGLALLKWNGERFEKHLTVKAEDVLSTEPIAFNRAGSKWYFMSSIGRDKTAIYEVDWITGEQRLVAAHEMSDVTGWITNETTGELILASAEYLKREWISIDAAAGLDVARLERQLGATIEIESQSADDHLWIVAANRPDRPLSWHLLDRATGKLEKLFSARPKLEGLPLAPMHPVIIPSRDGLDLVCYLTLPVGFDGTRPPNPLPMVLEVHGGPWARDGWQYNRDVQWYANRNYAVLQVNYRGSRGFGKAFVNAGDREWGGRMHDDLIDAVDWAIAEGIADPKRVAICGASYGGYAAFVGATFTPDTFCCSVPVVGITNLETMIANEPPYWASYYEQECLRVGDPRTEEGRALLRARSPLHRVDNISRPMLIGHGANDVRCKIAEAEQIVSAMTERNIPVTYVVFPDEGHGFAHPANNIAFNAIAEAFLAVHLGGRFEPIGRDFDDSSHDIRQGGEFLSGAAPHCPAVSHPL